MPDKRKTSMSLTEEVFDYLEEEQERRGLTTRQDTVEAIIRENMRRQRSTDDASDETADARPLSETYRRDVRERSTTFGLLGAITAALGGGNIVAVAVSAILIATALLGVYYRWADWQQATADADDPAGEPVPDGGERITED